MHRIRRHHTPRRNDCAPDAKIMGFVRDSVSVNGSALEKVKGAHYTACDILCFSHMLNNTGDRMSFPRVSNFMGAWLQLSTAANKIWKGLTDQSMGGYSETRWWSKVRLTKTHAHVPTRSLGTCRADELLASWVACVCTRGRCRLSSRSRCSRIGSTCVPS